MISKKTILLGASAVAFWATGAQAQQSDVQPAEEAEGNAALDEIVVSATRSTSLLQTTPIAVTALSQGAIQERGVTNLADVAAFVPGLSIGTGQGLGAGTANIAIRGIGVSSGDSDGAVGTYVDDVYFASGRGNILGLMDTSRVEVLRGPQGTLFGRNTIAGAILYVTNAPTQEFEGYVTGTVGSFERTDLEAAINVPVSSTFALRFAGRYANRDGYVFDEFSRINRGSEETAAGRVRALWTPTERLTIDLKFEHVNFENNGRAALNPVGGIFPNAFFGRAAAGVGGFVPQTLRTNGPSTAPGSFWESNNFRPGDFSADGFDAPDFFKFRQSLLQSTIEYELSDTATLKSITSISWFKHELASDIDQTPLNILSIIDPNFRTRAFTQELQITGSLADGALRYTGGIYYFNRLSTQTPTRSQRSPFFLASPFAAETVRIDGEPSNKNESIAAYAQASYDITDALTATVGLRYSREDVTGELRVVPGSTTSQTFDDFSPHFGLDFRATDDLFFYAKASKGFRAGGFTLNPALPGGSIAFTPETAWTYELGMRLTALDRRLRFNPTIFQTDWSDIQFLDNGFFNNTLIVLTRNAGDARIRGGELESEFAATDNLTLRGSFAYTDAQYTRVAVSLTTGQPITSLNQPLSRAPEFKYTIGARYTLPLNIAGEVTANADYNWVDEQESAVRPVNTVTMPSVGLLNARLQYTSENRRFSVAVFGSNLTNEFYLLGGTRFGNEGSVFADTLDVARPREIGAEVRFTF